MGKTVKLAERLLPAMVDVARERFGDDEVPGRVLGAWLLLSGIRWTSEMVDRVEQEMAR